MTTHSLVPRSLFEGDSSWSGLDRLFDDIWHGFGVAPVSRADRVAAFAPRLDIEETEEALLISAELPGLEEKDFDVTLEGDVLTLTGERRDEREHDRQGFYHRESYVGRFRRALRLPFEPDPDAVAAAYHNGVLRVEVRKPEEARPRTRTIPVTVS